MSNSGRLEFARPAANGDLWDDSAPLDPLLEGAACRLTKRAALSVVFLLSIGLWAAIWAAIASVASAALG